MEIEQDDEYDVFLSFRGPDTRHGFTDFLYHGLIDAGVRVFRDSELLFVGEKIGGTLLKAIERSRIYVPIFSENFTSSRWCLRELAQIMECTSKSNGKKETLPIYLDVKPEDVKLKTQLYKQAILTHKEECDSDEVKRWESALVDVAHIKGWNWERNQG